ncbi:hypothetical protein LOTGIDRAFT_198812 [Lottia gigantea]|uniref:Centriolar satellite-associated tubulin polyglutamylase complex regulator 1 n=1 Tax=Lottia gigantea TaxID=225164 RepID=V4B1G2_LOTGI|nr:hypothetical protein LOTGIDRAFT_198812 [Lottia gigantea]ESP04163.1 hypothetical protein LOTGIDRAFT_198812 [Lottia gigantea]
MAVDDRYSMSADKYLAKHNILVYLEDSVAQLLEHKEENSKVNAVKFLSDYFSSVRDGNHTMFREYTFIHSTPHNRASFVRLFWKCYRQIGKKGDLLSIQEYHSLLGLICPDFPFDIVKKTAKIVLIDDALDCLISFTDFVYAFQTQLYFEEFVEKCSGIYQSLLQSFRSPREPVVVPTSGLKEDSGIHLNNHQPTDDVDSMQFFRAIYPICDKIQFSSPPISSLKEILFHIPRISFYGFMIAIAKSESINSSIGRLPPKIELLEGGDTELTSSISKNESPSRSNPPSRIGTALVRPTVHLPPRSKSAHGTSSTSNTKLSRKKPAVVSSSSETDSSTESSDSI